MLPGFVDRGPVATEDAVDAFEVRCGFRLPPDYRRFLLEQNGGERAAAPPRNKEMIHEVGALPTHRFFSLGAAAHVTDDVVGRGAEAAEDWPELLVDLEVRMRWWRDGGCPADLLLVAEVYFGELLLRLDGPDAGAVLYSFDPSGHGDGHCEQVAGSFAELLLDFESWEFA
jgi:hypothetical protein